MSEFPHLTLSRAEFDLPRKKTGYGRSPARDVGLHAGDIRGQVEQAVAKAKRSKRTGIDPRLILRVQLHEEGGVEDEAWERSGLQVLSVNQDRTLVLFSSDAEMSEFRDRLEQYGGGPKEGRKQAPHTQFFSSIDSVGDVLPEDRVGRLLAAEGVQGHDDFSPEREYTLDVELWDIGDVGDNQANTDAIAAFIQRNQGRVADRFVSNGVVLLRVKARGVVFSELLQEELVACIDSPPVPTMRVAELLRTTLGDLPPTTSPPDDAPAIAVLDSGLSAGHPLLGPAIGEITSVPDTLGDAADVHGHGTMVGGIALYGDVSGCIERKEFVPRLVLYSARVLNEKLEFDDETLILTQMREAIQYFRSQYGCRVFNASLGDDRLPYSGGKVSPWASVLDTLSRELDVVIVVSAGNYSHYPDDGERDETADYPGYLMTDPARIIEPGTGLIVVTVGALSESGNVPGWAEDRVGIRPIAGGLEPSPFTRSGPGPGGAVKPEFCELGGNELYDGTVRRRRQSPELGVVSTNRDFLQQLFCTDIGTSYAAPRVSHIAARLLEHFPQSSSNLVRALLALSAQVPESARTAISPMGDRAVLALCGYGRPDLYRAAYSSESRAVLHAENELLHDQFHIYEVPIPLCFREQEGTRSISVSLAFDPPVRHSRIDYLGVRMSWRIIRGKRIEDVAEAFRQRTKKEDPVDRLSSTRYECKATPAPGLRDHGTLQCGSTVMKTKPKDEWGDTYFVVVRCEKKWASEEHSPQRYALAVSIEQETAIDLYAQVRERLRVRQQIGLRTV